MKKTRSFCVPAIQKIIRLGSVGDIDDAVLVKIDLVGPFVERDGYVVPGIGGNAIQICIGILVIRVAGDRPAIGKAGFIQDGFATARRDLVIEAERFG